MLPEGALFVETSGASLVHKGVAHLEGELARVKRAGGGVVFVDEAYQLVSDRAGEQVLDFILPLAEGLAEGKYGPLVWLFAGYAGDMGKLFEHNQGLSSRFPLHFNFQDLTDEQLLRVFRGLMTAQQSSGAGSADHQAPDHHHLPLSLSLSLSRCLSLSSYLYLILSYSLFYIILIYLSIFALPILTSLKSCYHLNTYTLKTFTTILLSLSNLSIILMSIHFSILLLHAVL